MTTDPQTSRYRKRPVEIEARQWDGTADGAARIIDWILGSGSTATYVCSNPDRCSENDGDTPHSISIQTLEGDMTASFGDWIIKGVAGEFYPCRNDIFRKTYEPAVPVAAPPTTEQGVLREVVAEALMGWAERNNDSKLAAYRRSEVVRQNAYSRADAVLAVLPAPADRAAVVPPPALTEEGRLRMQVEVLQQDAERDRGLAKVGARCMREGHQGLIEGGRLVLEGWRFALSTALGLGTGAPWEAIHERVKELSPNAVEAERAGGPSREATTHRCGNCEGVDPDLCLTNLDRPAVKAQQGAKKTPDEGPGQWCKCPSCWGWFVEDHPGEDLDELGRDLGWWSGLPEHRAAPAVSSRPGTEQEA